MLALLSADGTFAIACSEALGGGEASLSTAIHVVLVEMLLLTSSWIHLAHVRGLLGVSHLAVLFVTGKLIGIDHREHLGEALTDACNPLGRVPERQLVPWHEFNTLAVHIDKTLLAGGTRETTKRLLAEHGIFLVFTLAALSHHQVVQILEVPLKEFERFASVGLVCELLR